jgi:hypothetical protein
MARKHFAPSQDDFMKTCFNTRTLALTFIALFASSAMHARYLVRPNSVSASINNPISVEGTPLLFTITLSSAPNTARSLLFSTDAVGLSGCTIAGSSAQPANGAFVGTTQTVHFAVGQTLAVVAVATCENRINGVNGEDLYPVIAHILLPSANLTLLDDEGRGFILENDRFPPVHP